MSGLPTIGGSVQPGFERCRDAFAAGLQRGEIGAACAIRVGGVAVVDLWGGIADPATGRPWQEDTIVPVFSVTKGVAAICVLHLVAQGLIDLDRPVAHYWPDFAAGGKDGVTVRQALAHRAGVPYVDDALTLADLGDVPGMAARLAAQSPMFAPGSAHLYHAVSIGWITSELVRQTTGLTLGAWLAAEIAGPLGLSLFIGLPEAKRDRVARLAYRDPATVAAALAATMAEGSVAWRTLTINGVLSFAPDLGEGSLNDPRVQALELAGASLISDARSLATLYAACLTAVNGIRLLSDAVIADATRAVSTGRQFGVEIDGPPWGAGLMIPWPVQPMLGSASFGHDGMGGSLAFADPERGVSFAYVRNGMATGGVRDPDVYAVVDTLRTILDEGNKS